MSKKRLVEDIIISIRYSRLKEEITDTKTKNENIKEKKIPLLNDKKVNDNNEYIEKVTSAIKEIEQNSMYNYKLVEEDLLNEKIEIINKQKKKDELLYGIAINTALDNTVDYQNTDDYLEYISKILFDDKNKVNEIKKKAFEIYLFLLDKKIDIDGIMDKVKGVVNKGVEKLQGLPKFGATVAKGIAKHPKAAAAIVVGGVALKSTAGLISKLSDKFGAKGKFKKISNEELEYQLLETALTIIYYKDFMDIIKYQKYHQKQMKRIYSKTKPIYREVFFKWKERESGSDKIVLCDRFFEYFIKKTDFIKL